MSYDEELRITYAAIVALNGRDSYKANRFRQAYVLNGVPFERIEELVNQAKEPK